MIVGILCLICSLFATAQKPVAPRGSFSKPGLIARANLQSKNASALFAASPKAFHSASFSEEDGKKCSEECEKSVQSREECKFEKCPQYDYCRYAEDDGSVECSVFEGEYKQECELLGVYDTAEDYCATLYDPDEEPGKSWECRDDLQKKANEKKTEWTKKCYEDTDVDDLRSWQEKCAGRCHSVYETPVEISSCARRCLYYSDCPKDSQSDYEDFCIKRGKTYCAREYKEDNDNYKKCVEYEEERCEKQADVLCPKVQAWVIILIVVLVVVVAACVVVAVLLFLKFRKGGDQSKSDSQ